MTAGNNQTFKLEKIANEIRADIIKMLVAAGSGHSAGSLGMADVFTTLYFAVAKINSKKPADPKRDRIILSNGHICPVLYAALAQRGFFPHTELLTLRRLGPRGEATRLQGHPHLGSLPGVENTGGPLGQGASFAVGVALALKMQKNPARVFLLMSDGEQEEGQTWEAVMLAAKYKLDNLVGIIDYNNIQIDGFVNEVMPSLAPLRQKYEAFGWRVIEVDGHNFSEIIAACGQARAIHGQPTLILAHTIPGKGVDFMENKFEWHGKTPTRAEARAALHELRTLGGKIIGEHE